MLNDGLNARKFKEGIREIVVSDRHVDVPSVACDVEAPSGRVVHPENHRDFRLFRKMRPVGGAVQPQALFAEAFAVVRHVKKHGVAVFDGGQFVDRGREELIGVGNGVVVGHDDVLGATFAQVVLKTSFAERPEGGRRAAPVGGTVVPYAVKY